MPRNGAGLYTLPNGPVVFNTVISETDENAARDDIATALTNSLSKDGQTVPTANLPMGGYKVTGLGAGTAPGDAINYTQMTGSTGGALVGVIDSGTGAVARNAQVAFRDTVSILSYCTGDGADEHVGIQKFFDAAAGRIALIPPPSVSYNLGTVGVVLLPGYYVLHGAGRGISNFVYSGTGIAIDGTTNAAVTVDPHNFSVTVSNDAATPMSFGNATQALTLHSIGLYGNSGASNTGTSLLLDANATADQFSGQLTLINCALTGCKYGVRMIGGASQRSWTTVLGINTYIIGRSAGIISGSRGIYCATNGVGTTWLGGSIESYGLPIETTSACVGITYSGDMEGNASDTPTINAATNAMIFNSADGRRFNQSTNGVANLWYQETYAGGSYTLATYFNQESTIWTDSGLALQWMHYRGPSSGASKTQAWGVVGGASFANPESTYFVFGRNKWTMGTAVPSAGAWCLGDEIKNKNSISGQPNGWRCNATGTFSAATDSTGDTTSTSTTINGMTSTAAFNLYDFVNVSAGFATLTGLQIVAKTATSITVDQAANASVNNITVDTSDPTFTSMGNIP